VECAYLNWKRRLVQVVPKNAPPALAAALRLLQDKLDELEYMELLVALEELLDDLYARSPAAAANR
jgi:hypothetical protein